MHAIELRDDNIDFPQRRRQKQFERAAAPPPRELAHRDERHQQDQLDGGLEEDVHKRRLLADDPARQ